MLDFTSSLYLGMTHGSATLAPFDRLTLGVPAALGEAPGTAEVERRLAERQGCERATLATSTLHVAWDLFGLLSRRPAAIHVDAGAYPILRWGVERAAARGVRARSFGHHDGGALLASLDAVGPGGPPPVIVTDGLCPACGKIAPLAAYLDTARARGGLLVVDDTQALGVLGSHPAPGAPYGSGGGGSLCALGVGGPDVLVVASLAKGYGAPLAALSGPREAVERFEREGETRAHCSPPSVAAVRAAGRALDEDDARGDALRARLATNVRRFQQRLGEGGLRTDGGLFPVQSLPVGPDALGVRAALARRGIRTFLHEPRCRAGARVGFVLRADHEPRDVDHAARAVIEVINAGRRRRGPCPAIWT